MEVASPPETLLRAPIKHGRKVKTGCRTCKIRSVKCDEGRPACDRCVSTGRICDGYGIWGGGSSRFGQRPDSFTTRNAPFPAKVRIERIDRARVLAPGKVTSAEEQRYLEWFKCRTSTKLPGVFGTFFWEALVFQASSSEPAVLHAVLALSSAHKRKDLDNVNRDRACLPLDRQEEFMLQQYSKAIGYLQPHFRSGGKSAVRVASITCLMFVFLEFLRGNYKTGCTHLESGLKLVDNVDTAGGLILDSHDPLDRSLTELFARLQVQVALFGQLSPENRPQRTSVKLTSSLPTMKFRSHHEARNQLDTIFETIEHITSTYAQFPDSKSSSGTLKLLGKEQRMVRAGLNAWMRTYEATISDEITKLTFNEKFGYRILSLYHTMATIMTATCLSCEHQSVYDDHLLSFLSIIAQGIELFAASTAPEIHLAYGGRRPDSEMSASISDIGWIPQLYFTAIKCRNHRIRVQAVRLLLSFPHKEGIWDANLAASVATEVIRLEEGDFFKGMDDDFSSLEVPSIENLQSMPVLPEECRFQHVQVALSTMELRCSKRATRGEWKTVCRKYDRRHQVWDDFSSAESTAAF